MPRIIPKPCSTTGGGGTPDPHASTHISGGSDQIDGDRLDIDYSPTNYTPSTLPPQVTSIEELTAHLAGIDAAIAGTSTDELIKITASDTTAGYLSDKIVAATGTPISFNVLNGGGDEDLELDLDGDQITIDFTPTNYTPDDSIGEADEDADLSAHLAGIDNALDDFVTSSSSPVSDGSLAVYDGTSGNVIREGPFKIFPSGGTDPVGTPAEGDIYYNTTLDMQMQYDSVRGKWLSTESIFLPFGRQGNVNTGQYYRGINGRIFSSTIGWNAIYDGTVVSVAYTRTDSDAATFEIVSNGSTIASLASAGTSGSDNSINADFSSGDIIAARNASAGNRTSNVQGWIRIKWRA